MTSDWELWIETRKQKCDQREGKLGTEVPRKIRQLQIGEKKFRKTVLRKRGSVWRIDSSEKWTDLNFRTGKRRKYF